MDLLLLLLQGLLLGVFELPRPFLGKQVGEGESLSVRLQRERGRMDGRAGPSRGGRHPPAPGQGSFHPPYRWREWGARPHPSIPDTSRPTHMKGAPASLASAVRRRPAGRRAETPHPINQGRLCRPKAFWSPAESAECVGTGQVLPQTPKHVGRGLGGRGPEREPWRFGADVAAGGARPAGWRKQRAAPPALLRGVWRGGRPSARREGWERAGGQQAGETHPRPSTRCT